MTVSIISNKEFVGPINRDAVRNGTSGAGYFFFHTIWRLTSESIQLLRFRIAMQSYYYYFFFVIWKGGVDRRCWWIIWVFSLFSGIVWKWYSRHVLDKLKNNIKIDKKRVNYRFHWICMRLWMIQIQTTDSDSGGSPIYDSINICLSPPLFWYKNHRISTRLSHFKFLCLLDYFFVWKIYFLSYSPWTHAILPWLNRRMRQHVQLPTDRWIPPTVYSCWLLEKRKQNIF